MNFLVSDSQSYRHERIKAFLVQDSTVIAVLLASVDLEWTIRRTLAQLLVNMPELDPPNKLAGLRAYESLWNRVAQKKRLQKLKDVVNDWDQIKRDYQLRHDMVHGRQGSGSVNYVGTIVDRILSASSRIAMYGKNNGANPYNRVRRRGPLVGLTKQ